MTINTFNAGILKTDSILPISRDAVDLAGSSIVQVRQLTNEMKIAGNAGHVFYLTEEQGGYRKDTFYKLVRKSGNYEFITLEEDAKSDTVFTFADGSEYRIELNALKKQLFIDNGWRVDDTTWLSSIIDVQFGSLLTDFEASLFYNCSTLTSITFQSDDISAIGAYCFSKTGIKSVDIPNSVSAFGNYVFSSCPDLSAIYMNSSIAPVVDIATFGNSNSTYAGRNTYSAGTNILVVPDDATGYDTGYWLDPLQNPDKCGFTLKRRSELNQD